MKFGDIGLKEMESVWQRNRIAGAPRSPDLLQLIDELSRLSVGGASAVILAEDQDGERVKSLIRRAAKVLDKSVTVVADIDQPRVCFAVKTDSPTPVGESE